ncbi:MAG: 50S ribosomal protein L25 [Candidatus Dojkabacteria bacterium]|jgi:large subunit ribosomal protein L25
MEKIIFEKRDPKTKNTKTILAEGKTPAVVYNSKTESTNIMIDSSVAKKILAEATSTTILDAELDGKVMKAIVKEIDLNPITDEIRHIAFFEIDESKEMVFSIPFNIIGIAPAVKNNLGVLVEVMQSIEVRCKVKDLVPYIEVDISSLEHPGQSIAISDLNIPEGISFLNEDLKNATIVTITEMQEEEKIETPTEETEEGATDSETEGEATESTEEKAEEETKEE